MKNAFSPVVLATCLVVLLHPVAALAQLNVTQVRAAVTPPGGPSLQVLNTGNLAQTSSTGGGALASASTTRTVLDVVTFGSGVLQNGPRSASGDNLTPYLLWNPGENRALTGLEATGLSLSFNFVASGYTVFTLPTNEGGRGVNINATVTSDIGRAFQDDFAQFCGVNCSTTGNGALGGTIGVPAVVPFSVLHQDWASGVLAMELGSF